MGNIFYWILAALVFGIVSGVLYTWMSPRRKGWRILLLRSCAAYTVVALAIVYVIFLLA